MEGVSDFYGVNETTAFPFKSARDVLANVTIHTATCTNELLSVVANIEEEVLYRNQQAQEDSTTYPVSLLVLDSIAAPTRRDFGSESAPQRVSAVLQLAQVLKRLADQLQLVVVVINQVGLNETMDDVQSSQGTDLVAVKAALGTAWSHCLSTRLFLEHERDPHRLNSAVDEAHDNVAANSVEGGDFAWKQERGRVRKATVVKSNVAGNESMFYEIGVDGVNEIRFGADASDNQGV
jgi:RecA/RadA recombinase